MAYRLNLIKIYCIPKAGLVCKIGRYNAGLSFDRGERGQFSERVIKLQG